MNSSKAQQQKFIKVFPTLGDIIAYISNFKFSFITICYFLEINLKNVYKKKFDEDRFEFLVCFILKRIIINLKLNHSGLLLIFHSLIQSKEEELFSLYSYYIADLVLFIFDFIYIIFSFVFLRLLNLSKFFHDN